MKMNYLKRYYGQTLHMNKDVAYRNQDELTGQRKVQGCWVVETDWQLSRKEVKVKFSHNRPVQAQRVLGS